MPGFFKFALKLHVEYIHRQLISLSTDYSLTCLTLIETCYREDDVFAIPAVQASLNI